MRRVVEENEERRAVEIGEQNKQRPDRDPDTPSADDKGRAGADEHRQRVEEIVPHVVAGADIEREKPRQQRRAVVLERVVAAVVVGRAPRVDRGQLRAEAEVEHARHVGHAPRCCR